jgi:hypothetical protein
MAALGIHLILGASGDAREAVQRAAALIRLPIPLPAPADLE